MISGISLWPQKSWQRVMGCPLGSQNAAWMWTCFSMNVLSGRWVDATIHSSSSECSFTPQSLDRKIWNEQFTEVTSKEPLGWTLRKMYLLLSSWDTRPPEEK